MCHAIKHEHRLHGKVPWSGTIGGGHEHGKGAGAKDEQSSHDVDVTGALISKEGKIEMEKIAHPNADAIEQIERKLTQMAQGGNSIKETAHLVFTSLKEGHFCQ